MVTYLAVVDFEILIFPDFFVVAFAAQFGGLSKVFLDVISSRWAELLTKALSVVLDTASVIIIGVAG
jgi:hypothetical protein